ncbi:MAG: DUF362 domain-containing protein [Acidobacteria bacterium]|nr:DUF362 domain-containing protein [Acidobacteriota bacterium]
MKRRDFFAVAGAAPMAWAAPPAPNAPVSIVKVPDYSGDVVAAMGELFDQIGGLGRLVKNKTVTVKVNFTGSPGLRLKGRALGITHYTHPKTIGAMAYLMHRAGAKRIRFVESAWATAGPLEEYMAEAGWNVRSLMNAAPNVEFVNTNSRGTYKQYARLKASHGGYIFPGFDLNASYVETDVFVSMAKLKNHATCGVTLSMKNCFGNTPASIYGDSAGVDEPNENPTAGRGVICHAGQRQPSKSALPELNPKSPRDAFYRMPRITVDVVASRPIDLAFIDGIETMTGGEGPWIENSGVAVVKPGILLAGTNCVTTDTVATACMGYDPRAPKGKFPFAKCDNSLLLAEQAGLGTTDLSRIEVTGVPIREAVYRFPNV